MFFILKYLIKILIESISCHTFSFLKFEVTFWIMLLYWIMLTVPFKIFISQSWTIFSFFFAFSWECHINILLYYFVEKGHEALLSLHLSRPQLRKKNEMFQQYIYSFRHFYVSSAFSPCVFRIKIRFCQFSLQGKIKSKMVLSDYKVFVDL